MRNKINSYWAKYDGSVWLIGRALWHHAIASDFIRKVMATFATRIFLIGLSLLTSVIIARVLGPEGRGLYAVATTIGAIGIQVGNFGLHVSNTYYVAKDHKLLPTLVSNSLLTSFGLGSCGACLLGTIFSLWSNLAPVQGLLLVLSLAGIPLGLAHMLLQNLLLGINHIRCYNQIDILTKSVSFCLIGLLVFFRYITPETILSANIMAMIFGLVGAFCFLKSAFNKIKLPSFVLFRAHLAYGIKAYLSCLFAFIVLRVDVLMIQYILGEKQAGYYSISATLADLLYVIPAVVGSILFPKLSSITHMKTKWRSAQKAILSIGIVMTFLGTMAAFLAEPLVKLLYGDVFLPSVASFRILCAAMIFYGANNMVSSYLGANGLPLFSIYVWFFAFILNILLNAYAIPEYSLMGAAFSSLICYGIVLLFQYTYAQREINFHEG